MVILLLGHIEAGFTFGNHMQIANHLDISSLMAMSYRLMTGKWERQFWGGIILRCKVCRMVIKVKIKWGSSDFERLQV